MQTIFNKFLSLLLIFLALFSIYFIQIKPSAEVFASAEFFKKNTAGFSIKTNVVVQSFLPQSEVFQNTKLLNNTLASCQNNSDPISAIQGGGSIDLYQPASCFDLTSQSIKQNTFSIAIATPQPVTIVKVVQNASYSAHQFLPFLPRTSEAAPLLPLVTLFILASYAEKKKVVKLLSKFQEFKIQKNVFGLMMLRC